MKVETKVNCIGSKSEGGCEAMSVPHTTQRQICQTKKRSRSQGSGSGDAVVDQSADLVLLQYRVQSRGLGQVEGEPATKGVGFRV